jgi:PTH1 family peptidyl-tRNA hydrolase
LVIHDEIDFPVAKIQLKLWGSPAGHNWLKDILAKLWSPDFRRLRIGIDRPLNKDQVADYVLSNFSASDIDKVDNQWGEIEKKIEEFLNA